MSYLLCNKLIWLLNEISDERWET